ncbi:hypothetical protein MUK70_12745 [Dyadobacter chenwenxiniae]|uniref:Uncharacterized protein n=1 Tax=Dyadobacter chenwenxiniae TaxID=2906456 RepID=A0A9X1PJS8_9BACT|nr:hypothetical protein [Dyadobacter chenwenxiniae]MCF0060111.1 hypothetical protein [Dyadobacter chenwenxiniae]UON85849.1 hypothetical protein MUK70_12745 [Dyadobacter chenwenxiniae]
MEMKYYFIVAVVIILAIVAIVNLNSIISWGSLSIKSDNRYRRNEARVRGEGNKVRQGNSSSPDMSSENKSDVDGKNNDLIQE